jgi:hypothetical protein
MLMLAGNVQYMKNNYAERLSLDQVTTANGYADKAYPSSYKTSGVKGLAFKPFWGDEP